MSLIFCSSVLSCSYLIQFILPDDQGCQPLFSLGREESGCGAPPSKRPGRVPRPPASVTSLRGAIEVIVRGSGNLGLRLSLLWQIKRAERGPHTLEPFCLLPFWKGRIMCIFARFSVAFHAKIAPAVARFSTQARAVLGFEILRRRSDFWNSGSFGFILLLGRSCEVTLP